MIPIKITREKSRALNCLDPQNTIVSHKTWCLQSKHNFAIRTWFCNQSKAFAHKKFCICATQTITTSSPNLKKNTLRFFVTTMSYCDGGIVTSHDVVKSSERQTKRSSRVLVMKKDLISACWESCKCDDTNDKSVFRWGEEDKRATVFVALSRGKKRRKILRVTWRNYSMPAGFTPLHFNSRRSQETQCVSYKWFKWIKFHP